MQTIELSELIKIFIAGIALANGPCLFICAPIVIPCIGGSAKLGQDCSCWKKGLSMALFFSVFRLLAYTILGVLAVLFYQFIFRTIAPRSGQLRSLLGILVMGVGCFYLFRSFWPVAVKKASCEMPKKDFFNRSNWHMALAGLMVGFSPCPPLLAMLTYIAATAESLHAGFISGAVFGLGTVLTPLIPLALLTGFFVERISKYPEVHWGVRVLSSGILIYFGIRLFLN